MTKRFWIIVLAMFALFSILALGCKSEPYVAKVNGKEITEKEYQKQLNMMKGLLEGIDISKDEGRSIWESVQAELLKQMIDTELLNQAAESQKVGVTSQEIDAKLAAFKAEVGSTDEYNQILRANNITEEDLKILIRDQIIIEKLFDKVTEQVNTKAEQVRAKQIVVSTKEAADSAVQRLRSGAEFDTLAKEISEDHTTASTGGDLGYFPKGVMEPQVEEAAFKAEVGKIIDPIQTDWGYYIVVVTAKDPNHDLSPDFLQQSKEDAFQEWLDKLRKEAKIETTGKKN